MKTAERETTAETIARVLARGEQDRAGYVREFTTEHYENDRSHSDPGFGVRFHYADGETADFLPHRLFG